MVNGSAVRRLYPLGYTRLAIWDLGIRISDLGGGEIRIRKIRNPKSEFPNRAGARGRIRTFINLFLRQAPLPVGLRVRGDLGSGIWDLATREIRNPRSQIPNRTVRAAGFEPANTCSQGKPM